MIGNPFGQDDYRCRFDWGLRGAAAAVERGDLLVVVDVLSFSSAVVTAVHHGAIIIPCRCSADADRAASSHPEIVAAGKRGDSEPASFSLSPPGYIGVNAGTIVALPSPNGASCSLQAEAAAGVYAGCLLNATAVAARVAAHMREFDTNVTVLACGERWHSGEELRFAVEDYLGAGAIIQCIPYAKSPEAAACAAAYSGMQDTVAEAIWNCGSGLELRKKGYPQDVEHASMLNLYDSAPVLRDGRFQLDG